MVDNVKEQFGFPVNSEGEIVATIGVGDRGIVGALPPDNIPVNASGQMVVNLASAEGGSIVTAKTNPVTGRIRSSSAGILLPDANPSANRAVVLGDSRAANSFYDTYATDKNYRMNARGWWGWLQGLSGNYWNLVQAAGVSSDKIEDVTARFDNAAPGPLFGGPDGSTAGQTFGVSPYSPDWIFIELGINNLTASDSLAVMVAKAEALIAKCDKTGARVVWLTEGAVNALDYVDRIMAWNTWLKNRAATSNNLCVVDVWPGTVDPSSAAGYSKPNYLYDALLHPNPQGARTRADAIWAAVQAKWGVRRQTWLPSNTAEVYVAGWIL